jgi:hypothetical protein
LTRNIITAPANIGRKVKRRIAAARMNQGGEILSIEKFLLCIFKIIEIKLPALKIEEIPAT